MTKWNEQGEARIKVGKDRRKWTRWPVRPHKTYSELDPDALQAAVDEAERRHGGRIVPPAISAAIKTYLNHAK